MPFHIATIKNVSTTNEGQWTYLRINFQELKQSATQPALKGKEEEKNQGGNVQFPAQEEPNFLFIKELTLKNLTKGGENHLSTAFKAIKDLIKKVKTQEQEDHTKQDNQIVVQEDLILVKGKKELLENLVIRPNIVGKKTVGNLEIHQNGVRFTSQKGHNIDVTFSNIKHAFF